MTIEINEQGSEAFYKETVNVAAQYKYLLKNHQAKLKDYFKQYKKLLILAAAVLLVNVLMIVFWGADTFQLVAAGALLIVTLMCAAFLASLNKACKSMMADGHSSVLTLDENGAELAVAGKQTIRMAWENLAVVRVFQESVGFIPQSGAGIIISVDKKYAADILAWLQINQPAVETVR